MLGRIIEIFSRCYICDISQGPQLFLYVLRQKKSQKRYICAFHIQFIGRNCYHDTKQHCGGGGALKQLQYFLKRGEGNCRQFLDLRVWLMLLSSYLLPLSYKIQIQYQIPWLQGMFHFSILSMKYSYSSKGIGSLSIG